MLWKIGTLNGEGVERKMNNLEWANAVKDRDNWTCQECGKSVNDLGTEKIHAHHVHPKILGGENVLENGLTFCRRCHWTKYHSNEMNLAHINRKPREMKTVTASFTIKKSHAKRIDDLAKWHGVPKSVIMRNILERWDKQYIVMPDEEAEKQD